MKKLVFASNETIRATFAAANALTVETPADGLQWVQLSPYGEFEHPVGLQVMDRHAADAMVREFESLRAKAANRFRGAPFYVGHPDDPEVGDKYPDKKSYGWIKNLAARNDGLWGQVRWSAAGRTLIDEGHYQFLSPYWGMTAVNGRKGAYRPAVLISAGLTNDPNLPVLPVGANEKKQNTMTPEQLEKLRKSLGLAENASAEEIINAANEAKKNADAKADVENKLVIVGNEKTTISNQLKAANSATAVAEENFKTERKARVDAELTLAVNEGRIKEAQRAEWAGKLAGDFDAEIKSLRALKPALNTKQRTANLGEKKSSATPSGDRVKAINEKVLAYKKEHGCSQEVAFAAVRDNPEHKALFAQPGEDSEED